MELGRCRPSGAGGVRGEGAPAAGKPLSGRRIAVTRPRAQAGGLIARLEALGAAVIAAPALKILPSPEPDRLAGAVREAGTGAFDWILFTSVNGVEAFFDHLAALGLEPASLGEARLGAVGWATARRIEERGRAVHLVPEEQQAEGLLEALVGTGIEGKKVLWPRAERARMLLVEELRARGAEVVDVVAYRTAPDRPDPDALASLRREAVDAFVFTSSSTVRYLAKLFLEEGIPWPPRGVAICIGPPTAGAARSAGFPDPVTAATPSDDGIVEALLETLGPMS